MLQFGFASSLLIFYSCTAMARSSPPIRFRMFLLRPIAQGHLTTAGDLFPRSNLVEIGQV